MASSAERQRRYDGPALFSRGFRPFFLLAALWAVIAMTLWLAVLPGFVVLPTHFSPVDWHGHAMIFGYVPAVVIGFLLTAIPNWTGRLPVCGPWLAALSGLWLAGRIAVTVSDLIGPVVAAIVDLSFLLMLALVVGREILAGRNWRNLKVLVPIGLLLAGNAIFHWEAWNGLPAAMGVGTRLGLAATVALIMLIGGRIVPSFTRNWLVRNNPGRLPVAFDRYDAVAAVVTVAALVSWVAAPLGMLTAVTALAAALLQFIRLARWAGHRCLREPLVLILHIGYAFVPIGLVMVSAAILAPQWVTMSAAAHSWGVGAIGVMTLAVMTRASLGHTGWDLTAGPATIAIYVAILMATVLRILAPHLAMPYQTALGLTAAAWVIAFGAFVLFYGPILVRPQGAVSARPAPGRGERPSSPRAR